MDLRGVVNLTRADPYRADYRWVEPSRWYLGCFQLAFHFSLIPLDTQHGSEITGKRGWPQFWKLFVFSVCLGD